MGFRFFQIPARGDLAAEEELNKFLRSHRVLSVDRRWIEQGDHSFWALCVDFHEGPVISSEAGVRTASGRNKIDYRAVLSPEDFSVFARLRDLRKEISQQEAVPVYTIFTNEQLAKIVQQRVSSRARLEQIAGVGDARVEKYGDRILEVLKQCWGVADAEGGKPL